MLEIPPSKDTDAEDVVWGLQTADTLWRRGERIDALVWLRRAAQAAGDANDDDRALELARHAAELTEWMASSTDGLDEERAEDRTNVDIVPGIARELVTENPWIRAATGSSPDPFEPPADEQTLADDVGRAPLPPPRPPPARAPSQPIIHTLPPPSIISEVSDEDLEEIDIDEEGRRSSATSVPPAEKVHAGMFDPWAESGKVPVPERPMDSPLPSISAPEDEEVVTSVRPNAMTQPRSDAPPISSSMPVASPVPLTTPPKPQRPSGGPKPPPLPPRARSGKPPLPRAAPAQPPPVPGEAPEPPPRVAASMPEAVPPAAVDALELPPVALEPAPEPPVSSEPETAPREAPAPHEDLARDRPPPVVVEAAPDAPPPAEVEASPPEPERPAPAELPEPAPLPTPSPPAPPALAAPPLALEGVDAFADLPDDARTAFAAAATLHSLAEGEEIGTFALAYVVSGAFDVAATVVDAPAIRLGQHSVLRSRGTTDEGVPMRLISAAGSGVVATWSDAAVEDAFRTCPWVEDDLRLAADRVQAIVGITIGPLGERLDISIREQIIGRLTMRSLGPSEVVVELGQPVPGLILVGIGELELVKSNGAVSGVVGSGEFLFPTEVLGAGAAPATARAGPGGALVMFGDRQVAQELLVTCPPLLEVFAGM